MGQGTKSAWTFKGLLTATTAAAALLSGQAAFGQVINGAFDGFGYLTHPDWEVAGLNTSRLGGVTSEPSATEPPATIFTEDSSVLGTFSNKTTAEVATFLGGSVTASQIDALDTNATSTPTFGAAMAQTFNVRAGQSLTFQWNYISFDDLGDDFAFVYLSGPSGTILQRLAGQSDLTSPPDTFEGTSGETGLKTFTSAALSAGSYRFGVGVFNDSSNANAGQSLLMLDNVTLVPEPGGAGLAAIALGGLGSSIRRRRRSR